MPLKFLIADKRHAITEFHAALRFVSPLDPAGMNEVAAALEAAAGRMDLPAKLVVPTFKFEIGGGPSITPPTASYGYQRFAPDGKVTARISADANAITYMSREYPGWPVVRDNLADFMSEIGAPYFKRSQLVSNVSVQYFNEFYSVENGYNDVSEILRKDSPWVSGIARSSPDLWHSHVGQFLPNDHCKDLVNVNVDVVLATSPSREGDYTQVRMMILAARHFDAPGGKPIILLPEEARAKILETFDEVHALEKEVLKLTLSDSYLAEVNA